MLQTADVLRTDSEGVWSINLPPNRYDFHFTYPGYGTVERNDVQVPADDAIDLGEVTLSA